MMKMMKLMKMKMKMMKIKMKMMKMKMKMMKMKVKMSMMMMKKVSDDDGYFVMKVILWWNLSRDESYLVMKVMIVKEVMTGDISPFAMFEPNPSILFPAIRLGCVSVSVRHRDILI